MAVKVRMTSANLKFRVGNPTILWNKIMKEVKLKRYAGPFSEVPYQYFIQSPVGLVDKDHGRDTHLIFHLSYPRNDKKQSVNANTPAELCSVKYADFDQAIQLCLLNINEHGLCWLAKSDAKSAFRVLGLNPSSWPWLILKAVSPFDGKTYYFVDKCLPFGSSISCALFQKVSDAIAWLVKFRTKKDLVNYLDDFLFVAMLRFLCDLQLRTFLQICEDIGMPISSDKTVYSCSQLTFLGFLVDGQKQMVMVPVDKISKALDIIVEYLQYGKKKTTLWRLQQLCGFLNFLCRAVPPGRVYTRRLYPLGVSKLKPHHHLKITQEMRSDLTMWQQFLSHPSVFCRPFADFSVTFTSKDLDFYTDASRNFSLGCGGHFGNSWFFHQWNEDFMMNCQPSISYLELYALVAGVILWIEKLKNSRVQIYCDNQGVVSMVSDTTSSCKNCMVLLRILVLNCLIRNVKIRAKFVRSKANARADAISRKKFKQFHSLSNFQVDPVPQSVPVCLLPMARLWIF